MIDGRQVFKSCDLAVIRSLEEERVHDQWELSTGRRAQAVFFFVGALGSRHALCRFERQYSKKSILEQN